jgi:hypothetical protein
MSIQYSRELLTLSSLRVDKVDLEANTVFNVEHKTELRAVLRQYEDIFAMNPPKPNRAGQAVHRIDTQGHPPIRVPPYRISQKEDEVISIELKQMLDDNIRPSNSPWAAPLVWVIKDETTRCCVTTKTHAITRRDSHPLPRVMIT